MFDRSAGAVTADTLRRQLRRAFKVAGNLRNSQVALGIVHKQSRRAGALEPFAKWLRKRVRRQRRRLHKRLDRIDEQTIAATYSRIEHAKGRRAGPALAHALAELEASRRRYRRAGRLVSARSQPDALHRLRLHLKELRYATDILQPWLTPARPDTSAARLQAFQNMLGEIADREVVIALIDRYTKKKSAQTALAKFRTRLQRDKHSMTSEFARLWRRAKEMRQ